MLSGYAASLLMGGLHTSSVRTYLRSIRNHYTREKMSSPWRLNDRLHGDRDPGHARMRIATYRPQSLTAPKIEVMPTRPRRICASRSTSCPQVVSSRTTALLQGLVGVLHSFRAWLSALPGEERLLPATTQTLAARLKFSIRGLLSSFPERRATRRRCRQQTSHLYLPALLHPPLQWWTATICSWTLHHDKSTVLAFYEKRISEQVLDANDEQ